MVSETAPSIKDLSCTEFFHGSCWSFVSPKPSTQEILHIVFHTMIVTLVWGNLVLDQLVIPYVGFC